MARVDLVERADGIHLTIEDEGDGFEPKSLETKAHLGFVSMRERLRLFASARPSQAHVSLIGKRSSFGLVGVARIHW